MKLENLISIGDDVFCDLCCTNFTNSDDQGGFAYSSYAVCPLCAPSFRARLSLAEQKAIRECPENLSFADFVRKVLRNGSPGSISIYSL